MGSPLSEVVEGYASLASSLLERWSDHYTKLAARIDDGEFDGPAMTSELVSCAALATQTSAELAQEAVDAALILGGVESCEETVTGGHDDETVIAGPFTAPAGATLTLKEPLEKGGGLGSLPVSRITIQPAQLDAEETEFTLSVDVRECSGGTYVGTVEAFTDRPKPVPVWVMVP